LYLIITTPFPPAEPGTFGLVDSGFILEEPPPPPPPVFAVPACPASLTVGAELSPPSPPPPEPPAPA